MLDNSQPVVCVDYEHTLLCRGLSLLNLSAKHPEDTASSAQSLGNDRAVVGVIAVLEWSM